MNCTNCGASLKENTKFCEECGASVNPVTANTTEPQNAPPVQPAAAYTPPVQQPPQPAYAPPQQAYAQPVPPIYAAPIVKKKKHIGRWITLAVLLVIVCVVVWIFGSFTGNIFGLIQVKPKDLGVKYTQTDYNSAMSKIGTQITYDGKTGTELEQYKKTNGNKDLNINDYNFVFSDYQPKSFELTPAEATALLNGIAPGLFWFDNVQVNVLPDGTMEGSSTANVAKLKGELFSDVSSQIPIPLPNTLNIYSKGNLSITNNKISATPQDVQLGAVALPSQYMTADSVNTISGYINRIYTVVPGLQINSLKANSNGNIQFDGVIPQQVTVTKK